ncbi:MAG: hypothetical protein KDA05_09890 [Phycisphaerales bacterium]|nr:hypothetical protein [Phycisphaerales bacterium]MCB9841424.1 hypothetical protein [Phycisphaeraceae bacterium]
MGGLRAAFLGLAAVVLACLSGPDAGARASVAVLEAVGGARSQTSGAPVRLALPEWDLPVWPGTTLVIPLAEWGGGGAPAVRGARGEALESSVWALGSSAVRETWNGSVARWSAIRIDGGAERGGPERAPGGAFVVLAVAVPAGFHAEEIVVAGTRVRLAMSPELTDAAWVSPFPAFADWATLLDAAASDESSPLRRWRAMLLRAGVPDDPARMPADLEAGVVEALATQEELWWRAGLSRLHRVDPDLAARVRARLLPAVEHQELSITVPLWTGDGRALEQLRSILLDRRLRDAALRERVGSWLERQPTGVAWIERSFAEPLPGGQGAVVRAWAANLSERERLAWVEARAPRPVGVLAPEPVLLGPGMLAAVDAPVAVGSDGASEVTAVVRVGDVSVRRTVGVGSIAAMPPGVRLGPLVAAASAADVLDPDRAVPTYVGLAATLRRLDPAGLSPSAVEARARWSVLVEAVSGGDAPTAEVRFVFDHDGGSTTVTLRPDGGLSVRAPAGLPTAGYPSLADRAETPAGWAAEVPVPDWCVGLDGDLRVLVVRIDSLGGVWTWPSRATMLAPERAGAAIIDLGAWDTGSPRRPGERESEPVGVRRSGW